MPYHKHTRVRAPDPGIGNTTDGRLARDEVEAYRVAQQEKNRRKAGRREQLAEQTRAKITLPTLKFLEKEVDRN